MVVDHDLCVDDLCEGKWQLFLDHRACKLVLIGQLLLVLLDHKVVHGKTLSPASITSYGPL